MLFVTIFLKLSKMLPHSSSRDLESSASHGYLVDPENIVAAFFPAIHAGREKKQSGRCIFSPFPSLSRGLMNSGRLRVGGFKSGAEGLIFISSGNK